MQLLCLQKESQSLVGLVELPVGSNKSKLTLPVAAVPAAEKLIIRNVGKFASAIEATKPTHLPRTTNRTG